jgi:hypothetical protein
MVKPPNAELLKDIGRGFGLHLGDGEALSYAGLIEGTLAFKQVVPVLGCLSMALGAWYVLGALGLVTYPF